MSKKTKTRSNTPIPFDRTPWLTTLLLGFVMLTLPNGKPAWFNADEIMAIQHSTKGIGDSRARSQVTVHDHVYYLREEPERVVELVEQKRSDKAKD